MCPVRIPTKSEDLDEQPKIGHKVVNVVDQANRKICVTLLRHNADKPQSSFAQIQFFLRKKDVKKFQQIFCVKYKLEEIVHLFDVTNSVKDKVFTNKPICTVF